MTDQYEEEQLATLKKWWQENRFFVIAGILIGVLAVGGWYGWKNHTENQAIAASELYQTAVDAVDAKDYTKASASIESLQTDYADSPYAAEANLVLARAAVEETDYKKAIAALNWVIFNRPDSLYENKARYQLGAIQYNNKAYEDALKTLDVTKVGTFIGQVLELRGDVYMAQGEQEKAKAAYQKALDAKDTDVNTAVVRMKLNDIAG